ncbi:hypothetical protein FA13DRAFT_1813573 [Coprinellus micaceus]|uniref:C2H2-type domain-containing protein n=1 Tax=Coprinellus micaceus TaxID=71717 RepID=A0A4Y7TDH3_COPMI|nr:hypothetical protein FA13DRAFT_1813573 [Coprinellus micaceus]
MVLINFPLVALLSFVCFVAPSAAYQSAPANDLESRRIFDDWETRDLGDHWALDARGQLNVEYRDYQDDWDPSARDVDVHYAADILRRYLGDDDLALTPRGVKGALKDLWAQTKPYQCPYPKCDKTYRNKNKTWDHWLSHRVAAKDIPKIANGPKGDAYIRLLD